MKKWLVIHHTNKGHICEMLTVEEESAVIALQKGALYFDVPDYCIAVCPLSEIETIGWCLAAGELAGRRAAPRPA